MSRASARTPQNLPAKIGFLIHYGVAPGILVAAAAMARAQGVTADAVLIAEGKISEYDFYRSLARHLHLTFIDRAVTLGLATRYPQSVKAGLVPLAGSKGPAFLAAPRGPVIPQLIKAMRHNTSGRLALTTPTHFFELVRAAARRQITRRASLGLVSFDPTLSAKGGLTRRQKYAALAIATLIAAASVTAPAATSMVGAMLLSLALLAVIWLRLPACVGSFDAPALPVRSLEAAELPVYSVAIALYREARVVPQLLAALNKIDYPRAKLDFKFVIEEDDEETLAALADARHLSSFEIIVAPAGMPRTKPRALNVALPLMRGQFVTVFDAEDAPDPGQIKMAAQCFAAAPPRLACLQRYVGANAGRRAPEGWRAI